MPLLQDLNVSSLAGDTAEQKLDSLVKQLNEWGRLISNEDRTRVIKSDSGVEAITIGHLPDNTNGFMIRDETGTPRALFGQLPDGRIGIVISKEDVDVTTLFT